jgi:Ca-activated chloride channel family protein
MTVHALEPAAPRRPGLVSVDGRTYPLASVRVAARAEGGIAATTVTQVFENPHDQALEVIYTLPLPADGAVLGYSIRLGDKVIRGEVQPREQAEEAYYEALYDGRTAGLLEQDRADTFQQRLGNLPPHTRAEVEIEVLHPLAFLAAIGDVSPQWEFRFPTVVGVRYEGAPGRVADAERLEVDRDEAGGIPTRVELSLTIADALDARSAVASPSHAIEAAPHDGGTRVWLRQGERLDRDIAVRWAACAAAVGVRVVRGGGLPGDDGAYALITVTPPAVPAAAFARDVTILIDASGSMTGWPIECAKQVATRLLRSLAPGDRFEVGAFASQPTWLTRGLTDASEASISRATMSIVALAAGGGTEMLSAFKQALEPLRPDAQRQIVLITDGEIGFESEVVAHLRDRLPAGCRVHAVGIGSAPNRTLIHGVARAGRGTECIVGDFAAVREAADRLLAGTGRPVLTDLSVGGSALVALAPAKPVDVFAARPLVLTAELKPQGGTLEIVGRLAGAEAPWTWRIELAAAGAEGVASSSLPIGALHAREVIADLEQALATDRDHEETLSRIEARGMRHRIASRRTSLVAIAEEPTVDPLEPRRRERLAVELPAGVSAEAVGLFGTWARIPMAAVESAGEEPVASRVRPARMRMEPSIERLQVPARVIRRERDLLVVEFQVPPTSLTLEGLDVRVIVHGKEIGVARLVAEECSPLGPESSGQLARLAVRFDWHVAEKRKGRIALRLTWPLDAPQGSTASFELVIRDAHRGELARERD